MTDTEQRVRAGMDLQAIRELIGTVRFDPTWNVAVAAIESLIAQRDTFKGQVVELEAKRESLIDCISDIVEEIAAKAGEHVKWKERAEKNETRRVEAARVAIDAQEEVTRCRVDIKNLESDLGQTRLRHLGDAQRIEELEREDHKSLQEFTTLRANYHLTFNGGWTDREDTQKAFHHGMDTVFNGLESRALRLLEGMRE